VKIRFTVVKNIFTSGIMFKLKKMILTRVKSCMFTMVKRSFEMVRMKFTDVKMILPL